MRSKSDGTGVLVRGADARAFSATGGHGGKVAGSKLGREGSLEPNPDVTLILDF